jgi:hypothetical protein
MGESSRTKKILWQDLVTESPPSHQSAPICLVQHIFLLSSILSFHWHHRVRSLHGATYNPLTTTCCWVLCTGLRTCTGKADFARQSISPMQSKMIPSTFLPRSGSVGMISDGHGIGTRKCSVLELPRFVHDSRNGKYSRVGASWGQLLAWQRVFGSIYPTFLI